MAKITKAVAQAVTTAIASGTIRDIETFKDEDRWLSNFWWFEKPMVFNNISYPSVEHFYVAMKTHDRSLHVKASTMIKGLKRWGSTIPLRDDWDEIKEAVMLFALRYKFSKANPNLRARLIGTGNAHLSEGNWHGDSFWGFCFKTKRGENRLGKLLMQVRAEIIKEELGLGLVEFVDSNGLFDTYIRAVIDRDNPQRKVIWVLMASHAYYNLNETLISDAVFDRLLRDIRDNEEAAKHQHYHLIEEEHYNAGSLFDLGPDDYPNILKACVYEALKTQEEWRLSKLRKAECIATMIGSRRTPGTFKSLFQAFANELSKNPDAVFRSGEADGPDNWSRTGWVNNDNLELYLPEETFKAHTRENNDKCIVQTQKEREISLGILEEWGVCCWVDKLDDYTKRLYARNLWQILSVDYKTPSDVIFYYAPVTKKGKEKGGTAIATAIGRLFKVEMYNLALEDQRIEAMAKYLPGYKFNSETGEIFK